MASAASGAAPPPPLPPPILEEKLILPTYTDFVTSVISIKKIFEKVRDDYKEGVPNNTRHKAEELARVNLGTPSQPGLQINDLNNIDIQGKIIEPMNAAYEEYKKKIGIIKRLQSLAAEVRNPSTQPNDVDSLITKLDDNSTPYDETADADDTLDAKTDGMNTMLNIYRHYIYGYYFLYEIHRIYIHFGYYIHTIFLPIVNSVINFINENGLQLNTIEDDLRVATVAVEQGRAEARRLQTEINQLLPEAPASSSPASTDTTETIRTKQNELAEAQRALAAAQAQLEEYYSILNRLQQYFKTLSDVTINGLSTTVSDDIRTNLRQLDTIQHGGDGEGEALRGFIDSAGTRFARNVDTNLVQPAKFFFGQCVAVFTEKIQEYNDFVRRILFYYNQLKSAIPKVGEIVNARRDLVGLGIDSLRTQATELQGSAALFPGVVGDTVYRDRRVQKLEGEITHTKRTTTALRGQIEALKTKMGELTARFGRLEEELSTTKLSRNIENAKIRATLVGVPPA